MAAILIWIMATGQASAQNGYGPPRAVAEARRNQERAR
jgi:hypothetical protein